MSLHVLLFTAGILIALLHPLTLDAQTIRPAIDADRLSPQQAVDIDGRLDESFWHQIDPITNFRQQEPVEGDTPPNKPKCMSPMIGTICISAHACLTVNPIKLSVISGGAMPA